MIGPKEHIDKARSSLKQARYLLNGGFTDGAGRDAYTAGFHAALAFIVQQTGKEPKTHSGTRSEFARLARDDARLDRGLATFLANAYELKTHADYENEDPVSHADAVAALAKATEMVNAITAILLA